jgi:hypothetical protein
MALITAAAQFTYGATSTGKIMRRKLADARADQLQLLPFQCRIRVP